jgi:hypothetical protein
VTILPAVLAADEVPPNPLYDELITKGIALPEGPTVKLPAPLVKPGIVPTDVAALLEKAAGRKPVELFQKRTVNAPFELTIHSVEKMPDVRYGQMIDLTFMAYGKLDAVLDTDFMSTMLAGKGKAKDGETSTVLTAEELKPRGIRLLDRPGVKEQYATMTMKLLDKVQAEGVMRSVRTKLSGAVLTASRMDDRFQNDKDHPNTWRHIIPAGDEEKLGKPHPYAGMGGYVLITQLPEPKGALLVEMHFLLPEPPDWFGGPNLLRSKLPTVIQDNVRSFRRKLTKESVSDASPKRR